MFNGLLSWIVPNDNILRYISLLKGTQWSSIFRNTCGLGYVLSINRLCKFLKPTSRNLQV